LLKIVLRVCWKVGEELATDTNKTEKTNPKQGRGKHREHKFFFWKNNNKKESPGCYLIYPTWRATSAFGMTQRACMLKATTTILLLLLSFLQSDKITGIYAPAKLENK